MKLYTIIAGVNGVGKSSLTGALKAERSDLGIIIDVDKISAEMKSSVAGGKAAIGRMEDAFRRGLSFTQETNAFRLSHRENNSQSKGKRLYRPAVLCRAGYRRGKYQANRKPCVKGWT